MASEDVIELGSSEDETEPPPKKKKPMPNAMVHIPNKMSAKTKKQPMPTILKVDVPASKNIKPIKPIQIQMANLINPNIIRQKLNAVSNQLPGMKIINQSIISPMMVKPKLLDNATNNKMPSKRLKNPMALLKPKLPINLPPCITVKPLSNAGISQLKQYSVVSCKTKNKNIVGEVLTVELDDEEETKSVTGPQWYLRPEEHKSCDSDINEKIKPKDDKKELSIEEQNNKEPEKQHFVEITIEDSPVKLLQLKHSEIGKELPITIEDSPIKPVTKNVNSDESDNDNKKSANKVPQSKKSLKYPKDSKAQKQVVEIEINLMLTGSDSINIPKDNTEQDVICTETNSVKESQENTKQTHTVEVHNSKNSSNDVHVIDAKDKEDVEFHPTYQKFIDTCFELENSDDMKKIVDKKIKAYYKQSPKEYVESEEFIEMVTSKIISMKADPDKMYLYIKDIVDELNLQRKSKKTLIQNKENMEKEISNVTEDEKNEYDDKRQRQISKLEKTIKKLYRAIQKLEEQEVDFDDDEESVYLLTERYKERMVRVHEKLCQMTNTKMPSEPRIHIEARPGRPEGPAKRLEMWINKKVPIGTPLPFPDFHDVLKRVREANTADNLGWNEVDIMEEARDLFTRCGKKLQRRRQENEWRIASSRVSHHVDPAASSPDLRKRLEENKSLASKKETEVFNKYAERQNQLKLEAEEIGDKEADESPVESEEEEDDVVEISTLQDLKQKRKEKIKLLLKDKSKNEEKENNPLPPEQPNIEHEINEAQTKNNEIDINSKDLNKLDIGEPLGGKQTSNEEKVIDIDDEAIKIDNEANCISGNDDLNLLSELYSENKDRGNISPNLSSSDSIDTLDSDSDAENRPIVLSDVISIENSSYSENETMDSLKDDVSNPTTTVKDVEIAFEMLTTPIENNAEYIDIIDENILLGSSDEDSTSQSSENVTCVNLKDDNISITETSLTGDSSEKENINNVENIPENVKTADNIVCTNVKEINTEAMVDSVIHEKAPNGNEEVSLNNDILEMEVDNDNSVNCLSVAMEDGVTDEKTITGNEEVTAEKTITGNEEVTAEKTITGNEEVTAEKTITGNEEVTAEKTITGNEEVTAEKTITGIEEVTAEKTITGNEEVTAEKTITGNEEVLPDNNALEMVVDNENNDNSLLDEAVNQSIEEVKTDIPQINMETSDLLKDDVSITNLSSIKIINSQVEGERSRTPSLNSVEQSNIAGHNDLNVNDNDIQNKVINEVSNVATINNCIES